MVSQQVEVAQKAKELLESIQTIDNPRGRAMNSLIAALTRGIQCLSTAIEYDRGEDILELGDIEEINDNLRCSRFYVRGLIPISSSVDKEAMFWSLEPFSLGIEYTKETIWAPEWVVAAHKAYTKAGGFAGLSFKKYISMLRPNATPVEPKKRRVFGKHKVDGEETVDDETLFNVKRKVRDKAPRLKPRMGRI